MLYTNTCTVVNCRRSTIGKSGSRNLLGQLFIAEASDKMRFESRFSRFWRFGGLDLFRSDEWKDPRWRTVGVAKNPELGSSTVNLAVPTTWAPGSKSHQVNYFRFLKQGFETFLINSLTKLRFFNCIELVPQRPLERYTCTSLQCAEHF